MPTTSSVNESITVFPLPSEGAEDVLVSDDGLVYTGTADGRLHELDPATGASRVLADTGGRPLGLEWLPGGRILVCDAHQGLLTLDVASGALTTMLTDVAGRRMVFCNNAAVHSDGTIYFSDSSRRFSIERWKADMVEDTHSGRLLSLSPDGKVEVLVEGLRFANGVALPVDESFVAVAETTGRSVVRRWLTGTRRGRTEPFIMDLPGYPDNIARGTDGLIWVTIGSPVNSSLEQIHRRLPGMPRKLIWRLPDALLPAAERTAHVMAYDDQGRLVHDRQLRADEFHLVTGVREHHGKVWLGSLVEPAVACFDVY